VTQFSAGKGAGGQAVVFAYINDDLREFFGTKGHMGSSDVQSYGILSFSASQSRADSVFVDWDNEWWLARGHGTGLSWTRVM
jgi:hypothetical protein